MVVPEPGMSVDSCATVPRNGVTMYPATHPLAAGAQLTTAVPFPGAADSRVGADGIPQPVPLVPGQMTFDGADGELEPTRFVAVTLHW